jgi:uncharacterized protein YhfF
VLRLENLDGCFSVANQLNHEVLGGKRLLTCALKPSSLGWDILDYENMHTVGHHDVLGQRKIAVAPPW